MIVDKMKEYAVVNGAYRVARLCGYCGGAVDLIIPVFTQLHRSGFNLELKTLFESI